MKDPYLAVLAKMETHTLMGHLHSVGVTAVAITGQVLLDKLDKERMPNDEEMKAAGQRAFDLFVRRPLEEFLAETELTELVDLDKSQEQFINNVMFRYYAAQAGQSVIHMMTADQREHEDESTTSEAPVEPPDGAYL